MKCDLLDIFVGLVYCVLITPHYQARARTNPKRTKCRVSTIFPLRQHAILVVVVHADPDCLVLYQQ